MGQIRRPTIVLPPAPAVYDQREQAEFRRIVQNALAESVEDAVRPVAQASFTIPVQTGDDVLERYYYSWNVSGHPVGTTYNLLYRYTNYAGTLVEEGTVTGATSGGYIQSSGNIGSGPTYAITVTALNAGQTIASVSRVGTILT